MPALAWITAGLTFALMGITGFYAWSNYRVMRIMEADFRARTQPIPKLGIYLGHNPKVGSHCGVHVTVRTENAPMKLKEISVMVLHQNDEVSWAECIIGDPRIISPLTAAEFKASYNSCGKQVEWRAIIVYTDLAESLEYHTKVSEKGFSLTTAYDPPGLFRKLWDRANEKVKEMDLDQP